MQTFLLHTSILQRLSAPVCDAVLERSGSQQVLEDLERANLFITALDAERRWYRYHHLFAEALRYRLERLEGEEVFTLHLRASHWYARQGSSEAVHHALNAQAWQWATELIESSSGPRTSLFSRGESWTIQRWLQQLPEEIIRARPRLCLVFVRSLFLAAQFRAAEPWLQAAEVALLASASAPSSLQPTQLAQGTENDGTAFPQEHERDRLLGEILALRALVSGTYGESRATLDLCQQAVTYLSKQDYYEHAHVAFARGLAFSAEGQAKAATQYALECSAFHQAAGMSAYAISYMGLATCALHMQGQLHTRRIISSSRGFAQRALITAARMPSLASSCAAVFAIATVDP